MAEDLSFATRAAEALGVPSEIAAEGTRIATDAGNQSTRFYHTVGHFATLGAGSETIAQTLTERGITPDTAQFMSHVYSVAARDHDVVYTTADGKIPPEVEKNISGFIEPAEGGGYKIASAEKINTALSLEQRANLNVAMKTFGYEPGQKLNPFSGQNEFLSAVHSLDINAGMTPEAKVAVAGMIQSTVPFDKPDSVNEMADRVAQLGLSQEQVHALGLSAADFANRDVAAFAGDIVPFQEGSVSLLREAGADLRDPISIGKKAAGRAKFFEGLVTRINREENAIYRDYTFTDANGEERSLMSMEYLQSLNVAAREQIVAETARLHAMIAAAGQAMANRETYLPGSPQGEEIVRRAQKIQAFYTPEAIRRMSRLFQDSISQVSALQA